MFKINKKIEVFFIIFFMTAVTWNNMSEYVFGESGAPETNGESSGDWYIEYNDHISRKNETIIMNGDLIINSSGTLELSKVQLKINSTEQNRYTIWVKPGGTLYLISTTIDSGDPSFSYEFIVEGKLYMKNCTVNNVWGVQGEAKGGIQIFSDSTIIDSKINGSSGTGIYVNETIVIIYNSTISNCYYGIYYDGPEPTLSVSPSEVLILTNRTIQFNVTGNDSACTWRCSNTTVGTINNTGGFYSEKVGSCIITVESNNSVGKALVQVIPDPYTTMKISPTYAKLDIYDDLQFNVTNGTQPYNWTVDNSTFGTIDQNGIFYSNHTGISVIRVIDANNTTVSALVENINMSDINEDCLFEDNTFSNNQIALILNNVSPAISDSQFTSNSIGIQFINSSSCIESCVFENSSTYDLQVDSNSSPEVYFSTYNYSKISSLDSDNDSIPNYYESQYGFNQSSNDSNLDYDSDNLTNLEEFQYCTNPLNQDSDSDGMNDSTEIKLWGTNPFSEKEYLYLNQNLTIEDNQTLILSNSEIVVNSTANYTYGIYVKDGGSLYLESTEISSNDDNYTYEFIVEGYMNMTGCTVNNVEGNSSDPQSGIQLYSNSVILDTTIQNSSGSGIYINESNPTISNNTIFDCYYGIYCDGPIPKIYLSPSEVNITVNQTAQFIVNDGSSPYIWNTRFISANLSNTSVSTYGMNNTYVGIVNNTGLFTAANPGKCHVDVIDNKCGTSEALVEVHTDPGSGLRISPTDAVFYTEHSEFQFTALGGVEPYDWSSNDPYVAEIDLDGILCTGTKEGTCTITLRDDNFNEVYATVKVEYISYSDTITNNILSGNQYGIVFNDATMYLSENDFSDNNISMKFNNSDSSINLCTISNNSTYDLHIDSNSAPVITNTTYNYTLIFAQDSDSDGMPDWYEDQYGLDKNDHNDANLDPDNDNLTSLEDFQNGTNPKSNDTDFDNLPDDKDINFGLSPLRADTDSDGLNDYEESQDGVIWFEAEDHIYPDEGIGIDKVDDPTANDPDQIGKVSVKCEAGSTYGDTIKVSLTGLTTPCKYLYYLKARLAYGEPAELKIKYNDGSDHYVTKMIFDNHYTWFRYDSIINLEVAEVDLYAQDVLSTGRIYVDKGVFVQLTDDPLEVTTTDDEDDTIEFGEGTEEVIVNLNIPIEGYVKRYVTNASMVIRGVSEETGKGFDPEEAVTDDLNEWNNLPDIAVTTVGSTTKLHVVYQEEEDIEFGDNTFKVKYKSSTTGDSWASESEQNLGPSGNDYCGVPSIDSYDKNVHVVFASLEENDENIYYTKNEEEGTSDKWTSPTALSDSDSYEPNIEVDGNNVHVVWSDNRDDSYDVYYSKSSTCGDSWGISNALIVNEYDDFPLQPNVGVDSSNIHVIYDTYDIVKYTKLCNNGNTIIDPMILTEELIYVENSPNAADIAVDGKNIHVVWTDFRDSDANEFGEIYYKRSMDNGRTWGDDIKISDSTDYDSREPCIAIDTTNSLIYAFWSEKGWEPHLDYYEISYTRSADNGETWGSINRFSSNDYERDKRAPKAVPDGSGTFHVVWYEDFDGPITGPPHSQPHDIVKYNNIANDVPNLPTLDVGNDEIIDYTPGNYVAKYPVYDFSAKINEYIRAHEGSIESGYILVPLAFELDDEATIELLNISIQLGPDVSDPNDQDTDADGFNDDYENSQYRGLFYPKYKVKPFESSPTILQYNKYDLGTTSFQMETRIVIGKDDGLYCYEQGSSDPEWHFPFSDMSYPFWSSPCTIKASPAIADIDNDKELEIIIGTVEGLVYCLNVDGKVEWWQDTHWLDTKYAAPFYSSPAVADVTDEGSTMIGADGFLEIILVNSIGRMYRFNHLGVLDKPVYLPEYDPDRIDSWTEKSPLSSPSKRMVHKMAMIYKEKKGLMFGGFNGFKYEYDPYGNLIFVRDTYHKGTSIYDLDTNTWTTKIYTPSPTPREDHNMASSWEKKEIVLFGGTNEHSGGMNDETWIFDYTNDKWILKSPVNKPDSRWSHAMASFWDTDKILLFGGGGSIMYQDTWIYDISDNQWTKKSPSGTIPSVRQWSGMATVWGDDEKIILFGGQTMNIYHKDTYIYDRNLDKWNKLNPTIDDFDYYFKTTKHQDMTNVFGDDKTIVFSGTDNRCDIHSDGTWEFDLSEDSWELTYPIGNYPTYRGAHDMNSIYGSQDILLFGGGGWNNFEEVYDETWIWNRVPVPSTFYSSPVIEDINGNGFQDIVICDDKGRIFCLDYNGNPIPYWEEPFETGEQIKSTPAIGDIDRDGLKEIIVGCDDGKIYCLDVYKNPKWSFNTYSPIRSSPSIANIDVSTENLEVVIGSDNGVTYCLKSDGEIDWQFPAIGEGVKGAFKTTPTAVDLNSYPDGGYETVAMSEDGHIYCLDTVGAIDNTDYDDEFYSDSSPSEYPAYRASPAIADVNDDGEVDFIFGTDSWNIEDDTGYDCYPNAIKWGTLGAGTRHNGNGDNRFAILIEGTGTSPGTDWEDNQYKYNIQEMARLLTEHPGNKKPGPGYTGYYLQDHMFYVGVHDSIPEIGLDYLIMKPNIYWTIFKLAQECDSYDKVIFYYTAKGDSLISGGITEYFFDADDSNNINTVLDVKPLDTTGNMDGLCHYLRLVNCKDMVIMLQPDYSGDWIFPLSFDIPGGGFPQTNRVIITSEQSGQTSDFDLCNMEPSEFENPSPPPDQIIVDVYDIGTGNDDDAPFGDGEEYQSTPGGQWKYQVNKYEDSPHEDLYEIDDVNEDPFVLRFYENWNDEGAEFVSGFAEAYFIDLFNEDNVVSNDILDSDEYTINGFNSYSHFPSITGNDNDYVSCKEAYNYMKLWHIGYRLNKSPWVDTPQIEYTCFDDGTMYLY